MLPEYAQGFEHQAPAIKLTLLYSKLTKSDFERVDEILASWECIESFTDRCLKVYVQRGNGSVLIKTFGDLIGKTEGRVANIDNENVIILSTCELNSANQQRAKDLWK